MKIVRGKIFSSLGVSDEKFLTTKYSTDLMQRRTRMRAIEHHSPSAPTWLSMPFNGLKLRLALEFERKPRVSC